MYKHNRRKSSILVIVIVATAALTLLTYTSLTYSALAAKPGSSEKQGFKNLAACELNAAGTHSGQLTETEVSDCYLQAFSGSPISSSSGIGHNDDASHSQAVSGDTNNTNVESTNHSHTDSSDSNTSHHHHHGEVGSPHNSADSKMKSDIGQ